MIINLYNTKELLIAVTGICGEISQDLTIPEVADGTIRNCITAMRKEKIFFVNKKTRIVRFRWGKEGREGIKKIDSRLYAHYILMTNDHTFKSGEKNNERMREISEVSLFFLLSQKHVDNIKLRHSINNFGKLEQERITVQDGKVFPDIGDILDIKSIIENIPEDDGYFYNAKIFKKVFSSNATSRINMSKAIGLYMSGGNTYTVYGQSLIQDKSTRTAEKAMRDFSFRASEYAYGKETMQENQRKAPNGSAIILIKDNKREYKKEVKAVIKSKNFLLDRIFTSYHLVPDGENGRKIIELIGKKDWQERLNRSLYGKNTEEHGKNDGYTKDGRRSWELLSCNYKKIREINKSVSPEEEIDIICFKWQRDLIEELTKNRKATIRTASIG